MSLSSAWLLLFMAGILEISWVIGLKYSDGFTRLIPSVLTVLALAGSMYLLARATQVLPMGTAYGVWVGIGALGAAIFGILFFNESTSPIKIFFLMLLLISIIGLKITADVK